MKPLCKKFTRGFQDQVKVSNLVQVVLTLLKRMVDAKSLCARNVVSIGVGNAPNNIRTFIIHLIAKHGLNSKKTEGNALAKNV